MTRLRIESSLLKNPPARLYPSPIPGKRHRGRLDPRRLAPSSPRTPVKAPSLFHVRLVLLTEELGSRLTFHTADAYSSYG